jgi:predicted peroxiredoxin
MIQEKTVESLAEVTEPGIKYILASNPEKWLSIEPIEDFGEKGYCINGPFGLYQFVTHGNQVRIWKTLKGAIRFLRKKSVEKVNRLGISEWATQEDIERAAQADKEAEERRRKEFEERQKEHDRKIDRTQDFARALKRAGIKICSDNIRTQFIVEYKNTRFTIGYLSGRK